MSRPLGYFLSWGTYGTRLHGDRRGTVDRAHNQSGDPVLGPDEERWEYEREKLKFAPVVLTREQRLYAESIIPNVCEQGFWKYHTCAAAPDHIHVIPTWWAECGSIKWLVDEAYFRNAVSYVSRQRTR